MPQLEVGTYASQIFWLIIAFSTLYYLLSRKALPRIAEILEARQDRIAADLDQAQRLRADTEETLSIYEERMAKAREYSILSSNSQWIATGMSFPGNFSCSVFPGWGKRHSVTSICLTWQAIFKR